jgi:hypothetical protein
MGPIQGCALHHHSYHENPQGAAGKRIEILEREMLKLDQWKNPPG